MKVKVIVQMKAGPEGQRTDDRLVGYLIGTDKMTEAEQEDVADMISDPWSINTTLPLMDVSGHHRGSIVHINMSEVRKLEVVIE